MKASSRSKPLKIALVEDDADLAESIRLILENSDQDIHFLGVAPTAEQALADLPRLKPDLVLMDLKLPGMQGSECVSRLTALLPDVQVVVITVFHDTEAVFESLAAGALGYLTKPVTPEQLLEAVREVREGGAPMSSAIARRIVQTFHRPGPSSQSQVESQLSPRELEILRLLSIGCLQKEIADEIQIAFSSVRTYIARIYKKLHVHSRSQAVAKYKGITD